ncbi:MAG TPA: apolipoprotein N-acyltransferase [candidate division Zixibacteria bacterium]|nr:apolipoprotein N-acyltransferase [candidate division Zixibacteria bacterium]
MSSITSAGLASAVLLAVPFLHPGFFALAWVAFVPLFWALERCSGARQAALVGWLMGTTAHLIGFYWLVYTIRVFGGFPYPASAAIFFVYALLQGLQLALFSAIVRWTGSGPAALLPALFWVVLEFFFPSLFPWYLANSQSSFSTFIQTADLTGPYGASFIVMWVNTVLYETARSFRSGRKIRWAPLAAAAGFVIASVVYGTQRLALVSSAIASAPKLSVAAVQGNIGIDLKWNPSLVRENLSAYRTLSQQLDGTRLIIWPESAVEEWVPEGLAKLPPEVMPPLKNEKYFFIFGARSFRGKLFGTGFQAFNTAFLADGNGRIIDLYHKQVLLAFGEYIPFSGLLSKLPGLPFADGFTPGKGPKAFKVGDEVRVGPLICYEDLMPGVTRLFVKDKGANLLVNLTNDAWYGRSVAPWQHATLSRWRAIETRRTLLRATNTGVTALIDAKGDIEQHLPLFVPQVLRAKAAILEGETIYVRFGDWFAWCAVLLFGVGSLWVSRNRESGHRGLLDTRPGGA